jgi:hypothetical protein
MKAVQPPSITIRRIEFGLEKAEHGLLVPKCGAIWQADTKQ